MDGDRLLAGEALVKIVPLQHPRHGITGGQTDQFGGRHRPEPLAVENHRGRVRVEDLEDLLLVGFGILQHLLAGQRLAGLVLAGRVADHAGKIADEKIDL